MDQLNYYSFASDEDATSGSESSYNSDVDDDSMNTSLQTNLEELASKQLLNQCILHLDVDCFYCQCQEQLEPSLANLPFAIGQKHIIVTCNYIARDVGVKKLMLRDEAKRICPDLIIREGSDLEPFRRASRKIYMSFREAVKNVIKAYCEDEVSDSITKNAVKKGSMDEMYTDISYAVSKCYEKATNQKISSHGNPNISSPFAIPSCAYIYGNGNRPETISISEDQSGAQADICAIPESHGDASSTHSWGNPQERLHCMECLRIAAHLAGLIRDQVKLETKFTCCVGVSVSPMLAKLASDLKKPDSLNVLYPWRSQRIILDMPLRRIPELGSRTLKKLNETLTLYNKKSKESDSFWTCRNFLNIPQHVLSSMQHHEEFSSSSKSMHLFWLRCNGIDPWQIVDDNGELAKTVSVEDSFVRGSVKSKARLHSHLETLFVRLPRLLHERMESSLRPEQSYPRNICMTLRVVDNNVEKRRPFKTISKQSPFDGAALMAEKDQSKQSSILREAFEPLLESLLQTYCKNEINITRANIAVTSFEDIKRSPVGCSRTGCLSTFFKKCTNNGATTSPKVEHLPMNKQITETPALNSKIDPNVLAHLPPDIVKELQKNESAHLRQLEERSRPNKKRKGLEQYFKVKKKK